MGSGMVWVVDWYAKAKVARWVACPAATLDVWTAAVSVVAMVAMWADD